MPLWPGRKAPHSSKRNPGSGLIQPGFRLAEVGTDSEAQVLEWWGHEPNAGIGIICGARSRLLIIDVDTKNQGEFAWEAERATWMRDGVELPEAPIVRTPSGGYHLWFALPEDVDVRSWDGWLPGVDVLGTGHWAAAPPTFVRDAGRAYEFLRTGRQPITPDWFLEKVTRRGRVRRSSPNGELAPAVDSIVDRFGWEEALTPGAIEPGRQQSTLFRAACSCRAKDDPDDRAIDLLTQVVRGFTNGDESDPWTDQDARDMWERVKEDMPSGIDDLKPAIPNYRPQLTLIQGEGGSNGQVPPDHDHPAQEPPEPPVEPDDFDPGDDPQGRNTDRDNAYELVRRYGDRIMWTPAQGWWVYDGVRWERDTRQQLVRFLETCAEIIRRTAPEGEDGEQQRRRANRMDMVAGVKATLTYAEGLCAVDDDELDAHRLLLNFPNGTLDLATGVMRRHRAGDRITRCAGVEYDPNATSPLLNEYLATFMPDPVHQEAMFRLLGVCLEGRNDHRLLIMMIGNTTSGKSQLASGLERCLGSYVGIGTASIFRGNLNDAPRPDIIKLLTARIAMLEEAGQSWELHADRMKHLTGGGTQSARGMRSDTFIDRVPDFTPIIIANEMPRVKNADEATQRRMRVIPFTHRPLIEDPLKKVAFIESDECMRALVARLVAGHAAAQQLGVDDLPHEFNVAMVNAFDALDDVRDFIGWAIAEEKLVQNHEASDRSCVGSGDLYKLYSQWVKDFGDANQHRDRIKLKAFSQRLSSFGWTLVRANGSRWRGWLLVDPMISYRP